MVLQVSGEIGLRLYKGSARVVTRSSPNAVYDAQQIADKFKDSVPVILNLQAADTDLSKRLIDFASGLTYALDGGMQLTETYDWIPSFGVHLAWGVDGLGLLMAGALRAEAVRRAFLDRLEHLGDTERVKDGSMFVGRALRDNEGVASELPQGIGDRKARDPQSDDENLEPLPIRVPTREARSKRHQRLTHSR